MESLPLAAAPAEASGFAGWVISVMEAMGAPGAGLIVALENLFPPIPSELILPLAGFTASQGDIGLLAAILWTTVGSVVGALALYAIGALLGRNRSRSLAARLPLVKLSDVDKTEAWFERHGIKAVFFGRMVPLFRSFISLPAGIERMPLGKFTTFTTLGSLIWNTVFVLAGYLLGQNWYLVEQYAGVLSKAVLVVVLLAIGYFVVTRIMQRRRENRAGDSGSDADAGTQQIQTGEDPTQEFPRTK